MIETWECFALASAFLLPAQDEAAGRPAQARLGDGDVMQRSIELASASSMRAMSRAVTEGYG
jgi:hypothetical protein